MAKNKTAAEYAEEVKKMEKRLAELKQKAAEATKAEQVKHDADVLKGLKQIFLSHGLDWENTNSENLEATLNFKFGLHSRPSSVNDEYATRLEEIAEKYGTDIETLLDYISTDQQVGYFKRTHHIQ